MNEQIFAAFSCLQLVLMVGVLLLIAYRRKLIEIEDRIRAAFRKEKPNGNQFVKVINDFYWRIFIFI